MNNISDSEHIATIKKEYRDNRLWNFHACEFCPYRTKSFFIMRSHSRRHRVTRAPKTFNCMTNIVENYKCSSCNFRTAILVKFNKHLSIFHQHMQVKTENCEPCIKYDRANLVISYSCDNCSFKTYSKLIFITHYRVCPLNRQVKRNAPLDKQFFKWYTIYRHRYVQDDHIFQCTVCPYRAKRKITLDRHMHTKHCSGEFPVVYPCPHTTVNTQSHIRRIHMVADAKSWHYCEHCKYKSRSKQNLYSHIKAKHINGKTKKQIQNDKQYKCKKCKFESNAATGFKSHMYHRHPNAEEWFQCEHCTYRTIWIKTLQRHVEMAHGVFKCEKCTFKTKFRFDLKSHVLENHMACEGSESIVCFNCELCVYSTKLQWELNAHILDKHVASEQVLCFKCQLCTYKTIEQVDLRQHVLQKHIGTKSLMCDLCTKKYAQVSDLKKHIFEEHIL